MRAISSLCTVALALILVCALAPARAAEVETKIIRVAPTSRSSRLPEGTVNSLHEAQEIARAWRTELGSVVNVEIQLLPGRHELKAPLMLDSRDEVVSKWTGFQGSVVSGGKLITGWVPCPENNLWLCSPPLGGELNGSMPQCRHLYVNGRRAERTHNAQLAASFAKPVAVDSDKYTVSWSSIADIVKDKSPRSVADLEMVYTAQGSPWTESRCTVANVSKQGDKAEVFMKQPCFASVQIKPCGQRTVDLVPGAWYLKRGASAADDVAIYYPFPGEKVEEPVLSTLITATDLSGMSFQGITYEHATWDRPNTGLGYVEQQSGALVEHPGLECVDYEWLPMPSNIVFNGTVGVEISNCTFRHLGAGALQFRGGAHNNTVRDSLFYDISGTSVQIGDYNTFNVTDESAQEIGNSVIGNVIDGVACEYHGNAGISVGYSKFTTIEHNDVFNLSYSGVSIGWGWSREKDTYAGYNSVSFNRIIGFKLQLPYPGAALGDGGGIYALGPQQGSVMKENWLGNMGSGRGGGAFYPDEGSAYWTIEKNVFTNSSMCQDDCQWLHIWTSSIHDINTTSCWTDTATQDVAGTNTPVTGTVVVPKGTKFENWPQGAQDVMAKAGVPGFHS